MAAVALAMGLAAAAFAMQQGNANRPMRDVLDMPVPAGEFNKHSPASSVARQGDRLVAVGPRGLIVMSSDGGSHWAQMPSPVQSDLVSVRFSDANTVWAVGHDAVALRSADGGASWQRVLDGRSLLKLLRGHYPAQGGPEGADKTREEVERWASQSATLDVLPTPFLDVSFADANDGFLVGAFGLVLHTVDGGKTWTPWIEHTDNPRRLHLYAVAGHGTQRYIAGEQGLLLRLDPAGNHFAQVKTPYEGTFFGVDVRPGRVLAYGLSGNAYVSKDEGTQWRKLATGTEASLVAAVPAGGEGLLLVSDAGQVLSVSPDGSRAVPLQIPYTSEVLGAATTISGQLVLALVNGLRVLDIMPVR
ncbi:hypothetical protein RN01_28430 [Cupriavidus sp. SHE]|jgi:photosystem II stability/assembly factor-like uncharacterized protein|uniref:Glycosyl hydrolase n=2 Tax=Burkholderiaceae TaxID=119060 RepID=A0A482ISH3_9BURK|nr:hypothetical protein RN01_28430 [Cupriavidus sp. SHE]QBP11788.1 glycosyl hydrolase [Cupriavidus metallidurans]